MSTTSRFSLRRLLLALLDNQHQLDERERAEAEAKWSAGGRRAAISGTDSVPFYGRLMAF